MRQAWAPNKVNGGVWTVSPPPPDFKPNEPLELSREPLRGLSDPVTSFALAANRGNYSVETAYTVTVHNLGGARTLEYWADSPGDYILEYEGALRAKLNAGARKALSVMLPAGESTTFTFSMAQPEADAIVLTNYFILR
jgi:hypothetical protein